MTLTRTSRLFGAAAVCLAVTLFIGLGGAHAGKGGEPSLEFVGQIISNVLHISMDRSDPTCPPCL